MFNPLTNNQTNLYKENPIHLRVPFEVPASSLLMQVPARQSLLELSKAIFVTGKNSKGKLSQREVKRLNDQFKWNISRANALVYVLLSTNTVMKNDLTKLDELEENLEDLGESIREKKANQVLDATEAQNASQLIFKAKGTIYEVRSLITALQDYNELGSKFSQVRSELIDICYDPSNGDSLQSTQALENALEALDELKGLVDSISEEDEETTASIKIKSLYREDFEHLSWVVEDWSEAVEERCRALLKGLNKSSLKPQEVFQYYEALSHHLSLMQEDISIMKEVSEFQPYLKRASNAIAKTQKVCVANLKELEDTISNKLPVIAYGDEDWNELVNRKNTQTQPDTWLSRTVKWTGQKFSDIANSSKWSNHTKDVVYRLFVGLQLSQQVQGALTLGQRAENLKKLAEVLQKEVIQPLSQEELSAIEKDTSRIGSFLAEKYGEIQNPKMLEHFAKNSVEIRETLEAAIKQFGSVAPTSEQISNFMEAYKMQRLFAESSFSSPLQYMSLEEWWKLFTTPEEEIDSKIPVQNAVLVAENIDGNTKQKGVIDTVFKNVINIWKADKSTKQTPSSFITSIQTSNYQRLKDAVNEINAMKQEIRRNAVLIGFNEDVAAVHHELLKAISQRPAENCPMTELANWNQSCEDQLDALKALKLRLENVKDQFEEGSLENFLTSSSIPIDDKTLLNVLGDVFGRSSQLEGAIALDILDYRLEILRAKVKSLKENPLFNNEAKASFCRDLFCESELSSRLAEVSNVKVFDDLILKLEKARSILMDYATESAPRFQKRLEKEFRALASGESFFFQAGWVGHSAVYEFIKEEEGSFTFRIYNTGEGISSYYTRTAMNTKEQYLPFTEIVNVSLEDLVNLTFVNALQKLKKPGDYKQGIDAVDFYDYVLNLLRGKMSHKIYPIEALRQSQNSGVCSYMALAAVFTQHTGSQLTAKHHEFETQLKALLDYHDQHHQEYVTSEMKRMLIKKGLKAFATRIEAWYNEGAITKAELRLASKKLQRVHKEIKEIQVSYEIALVQNYPTVDIDASLEAMEFPYLSLSLYGTKIPTNSKTILPYSPVRVADWQPKKESLISDLKNFKQVFHEANEKMNYLNAIDGTKNMILKLPAAGHSMWQNLSQEEAEEVLFLFDEISKEYLRSFLQKGQRDTQREVQLKGEEYAAQLKLITIADQILREHKQIFEKEIDLFQTRFFDFIHNKTPSFQLKNPKWEIEFGEIKNYWLQKYHERPPQFDFFGFDVFPAGEMNGPAAKIVPMTDSDYEEEERYFDVEWAKELVKLPKYRSKIVDKDSWTDFDYGKKWRFDNQLSKGLLNFYQFLEKAADLSLWGRNDIILAVFALSENIFPPTFYHVRSLAYITDFLLTGQFLDFEKGYENPDFSKGLTFSVNRGKRNKSDYPYNEIDVWEIRHSIFGLKSVDYTVKEPRFVIRQPGIASSELAYGGGDTHLTNAITAFQKPLKEIFVNEDIGNVKRGKERAVYQRTANRLDPNKLIRLAPYQFIPESDTASLNFQQFRELLGMISYPEEQIQETLAYFLRNPKKLKDLTYQKAFKVLMFDPGLLLDQFRKHPEESAKLATQLAEFCRRNYKFQSDFNNINVVNFFIEINQLFESYIKEFQKQYPKCFPDHFQTSFFDSHAEILKQLNNDRLTKEQKEILYRELARSYRFKEKLSIEQVQELLYAVISYGIYTATNFWLDLGAHIEVRDLLIEKREEIEKHISSSKGQEILNRVYRKFYPNAAEITWKCDQFPRVESKDGRAVFDLVSGNIILHDGKLKLLPVAFTLDSNFYKIFGRGTEFYGQMINFDTFVLKRPSGEDYRLTKDKQENLIIERQFGKDWYLLTKIPFEINALVDNHSHWWNPSTSTAAQNFKAFTTDATTQKLKFRLELLSYKTLVIHELDDQGNDTGLIVADSTKEGSPLKVLERIELSTEMIILVDPKTQQAKKALLPRFDLEFLVESDGKVICPELSNYYLSERQGISSLGDLTHYLVLEKDKKRIVVFANQPLQETAGSLTTKAETLKEEDKQKILIYDVNEKNQKLEPKTEEERFYLALLYLWKHEYDAALKYLNKFLSHKKRYTPEEFNRLTQFSKLDSKNKDSHPKAVALRLKAIAMIIQNEERFIFGEEAKNYSYTTPSLENYIFYLNNREHAENFALTPEEEILIIKNAVKSFKQTLPEIILQRIKMLVPQEYGTLTRLVGDFEILLPDSVPVLNISPPLSAIHALIVKEFSDLADKPSKNIIRSNLMFLIEQSYAVVRDSQTVPESQIREVIENISGIKGIGHLDRKQLLDLLIENLKFIQNGRDGLQAKVARILEAVLKHPNEFISSSQFSKVMEILKGGMRGPSHVEASSIVIKLIITSEGFVLSPPKSESLIPNKNKIIKKNLQVQAQQTIPEIFQVCIGLIDQPSLSEPVLENREQLMKEIPISEDQIVQFQEVSQELKELFSVKINESVGKRKLKELQKRLADFAQNQTLLKKNYELTDIEAFRGFKFNCTKAVDTLEKELEQGRLVIESIANKPFKSEAMQNIRETRLIADRENPIDMDELIQLFFRRDSELFYRRNPAFESEEEIVALIDHIQNYLVRATYLQHLRRIATQADRLDKVLTQNGNENDLQEAVQEFAVLSGRKREYILSEHPEYLVFEYYSDKLLYDFQVSSLDLLEIKDGKIGHPEYLGVVLKLTPGLGKTTTIAPLLNLLNADGERLAMILMPNSLVTSMAEELQTTLKMLVVLEFNRETIFDADKLQAIYETINRIIDERRILLMSDDSFKSLYLKFVEKLHDYVEHPDKALEEEIEIFRKIFQIFREKGTVTIDEIHLILDVLKSFHYTIGEPKSIQPVYTQTISDLYDNLYKISNLVHFNFLPSASEIPFTEEYYQLKVKTKIIDGILNNFETINKNLDKFLKELNSEQKIRVRSFLNDNLDKQTNSFIEKLNPEIRDILSILKEEINVLIPLTASKNLFEHYGSNTKSNQEESYLAIPWHKGKPATKSRFGTSMEEINYTIQKHLGEGIPKEIVHQEIERIKKIIYEERKKFPSREIRDFPVYADFLALTGGQENYSPFNISEKDLTSLVDQINRNPRLQMKLIIRFVLYQIKTYPTQLNAESQLFGILFNLIFGMTGTPVNAETYTDKIQAVFESDTDAKTLHILWKNTHKVGIINTSHDLTPQEEVNHIIKYIFSKKSGSVCDNAGVFRGIPNRIVAEAMLHLGTWKGVAFYDDEGNLKVLSKAEGKLHEELLSKSSLTKDEIIAFWDQVHTTGSDIKLSALMHATVTFGRYTSLFELIQAVWRLRELDKGQTTSFEIASKEDEQVIRTKLERFTGEAIKGELELKHLLLYALYVQATRQGDDNYRSFKLKMQAVLLEKTIATFLDPTVKISEFSNIYRQLRSLFESEENESPYELYGKPIVMEDKEKVIADQVDHFLKAEAMQAFLTNPVLRKKYDPKKIEKEIRDLAGRELSKLSDKLKTSNQYGRERFIQVQTEKQKEKESEKETETQQEVLQQKDIRSGHAAPDQIFQWGTELFQSEYFHPRSIGKDPFLRDDGKGSPLVNCHAALNDFSEFEKVANFFDSNLLCSLNYFSMNTHSGHRITPFGRYQKDLTQVVVIQEKSDPTANIRVMLIDSLEAKNFEKMLLEDVETPAKKRQNRVALYHLYTGMNAQSSDRFDIGELEKNPQFQRLIVQAKFIRGEVNYSTEELKVVESWLKETDVKMMAEFFKTKILAWKEASQQNFDGSHLANLFKELEAVKR